MPRHRIRLEAVLGCAMPALLAGCLAPAPDLEGIGYRDARYQEAQAMRAWRDCRDEGLALEREAGNARTAARYLTAARVLEGCESRLGPEAGALAPEERMRAYAVAVQARLKGGDPAGARAALQRLRVAFPDLDLYADDGTSLLDSLDAVLVVGAGSDGASGTANVSPALSGELRRLARWRRG